MIASPFEKEVQSFHEVQSWGRTVHSSTSYTFTLAVRNREVAPGNLVFFRALGYSQP
jgi:hypothetical protein